MDSCFVIHVSGSKQEITINNKTGKQPQYTVKIKVYTVNIKVYTVNNKVYTVNIKESLLWDSAANNFEDPF